MKIGEIKVDSVLSHPVYGRWRVKEIYPDKVILIRTFTLKKDDLNNWIKEEKENKMTKKKDKSIMEIVQPTFEKVLKTTEQTIKTTAEYLKKETPEVAKEIIRWGIVDSLVWFIFGVILLGIGIKLFDKTNTLMLCISMGLCLFGGIISFTSTAWIKPLVTPRLYLLEWLNDKVRNRKEI